MGILKGWGIKPDEIDEILSSRPSLRGILMGFIAEYKISELWFNDKRISNLVRYKNHDRTSLGDFGFSYKGENITVQVKSLQTNSIRRTASGLEGKFQCDASDKRRVKLPNGEEIETTCLVVEGFDLLAVNIFQFSNRWEFAFAKNADLPRTKSRKYTPAQQQYLLATLVRITLPLQDPFRAEPFGILDEIVAERHKRQQDNVSSKGAP
ncbi:restriction endonuclease [Roseiflexus castenholzii]|uniref:restriction endonuclease n=1 Tax=Roseiflexus castenholzii TaxID=120962 RepID=UPI003C7C84D8